VWKIAVTQAVHQQGSLFRRDPFVLPGKGRERRRPRARHFNAPSRGPRLHLRLPLIALGELSSARRHVATPAPDRAGDFA
jgi:hypothetical protein